MVVSHGRARALGRPGMNRKGAARVLGSAENLRQTGGVVMRFTLRRAGGLSWTVRAVLAALLVSGSTAAAVGVATGVQAQIRPVGSGSSATVVHEAMRPGFGKILVTVNGGHSLYEHPNGSCGPGCRSIWPPLLMPAGTTTLEGASLSGDRETRHAVHQVTYHGQPAVHVHRRQRTQRERQRCGRVRGGEGNHKVPLSAELRRRRGWPRRHPRPALQHRHRYGREASPRRAQAPADRNHASQQDRRRSLRLTCAHLAGMLMSTEITQICVISVLLYSHSHAD